jgi:hypothetical protein
LEHSAKESTSVETADNIVHIDGKAHTIALKSFIHGGKRYTAADVKANPVLAAELVKRKSPALKKH